MLGTLEDDPLAKAYLGALAEKDSVDVLMRLNSVHNEMGMGIAQKLNSLH